MDHLNFLKLRNYATPACSSLNNPNDLNINYISEAEYKTLFNY